MINCGKRGSQLQIVLTITQGSIKRRSRVEKAESGIILEYCNIDVCLSLGIFVLYLLPYVQLSHGRFVHLLESGFLHERDDACP